jgi:hypothetical protein
MAAVLALSLHTSLLANDGEAKELLTGHPRPSYEDVGNIAAMEDALRKSLADHERYSFSRAWWQWDRPERPARVRSRDHFVGFSYQKTPN